MSLTDFISQPKVRERIDETFPNQGSGPTSDVQANWQTNNYALVGTAFDYLLRFWLRREATDVRTRPWVAENSLDLTKERYPDRVEDVQQVINRAEEHRDNFLNNGQLTRPLIESVLDLARVDWIYRSGEPPADLGQYEQGDIVDCMRLMEVLSDTDAFVDVQQATLNPSFGLASWFVAGADADVILDGTLLDVKTTSKPSFKIDYWRQLVGYLVLADIHATFCEDFYAEFGLEEEIDTTPLPDIDSFGVYFSRHGEVTTIDASVVYDHEDYLEFRSWFAQAAYEEYSPEDDTLGAIALGYL